MFLKAFVRTLLLCLHWQVTHHIMCIRFQKLLQVMDPAIPLEVLFLRMCWCFTRELVQCQVRLKNEPLQPRNLLCSPGPELDTQPEELLQKNLDHFSLPPAIKDKLFITFGLGDHPFGIFIVLWDVLRWHLPKPGERRERKGRWFIKIRSISWKGWVTVRTAAQLKYLDFAFMCVAAWPKEPVYS